MSNNPWPFVIVTLGSLGFLANSEAQLSNAPPSGGGASIKFGDMDLPNSKNDQAKKTPANDPGRRLDFNSKRRRRNDFAAGASLPNDFAKERTPSPTGGAILRGINPTSEFGSSGSRFDSMESSFTPKSQSPKTQTAVSQYWDPPSESSATSAFDSTDLGRENRDPFFNGPGLRDTQAELAQNRDPIRRNIRIPPIGFDSNAADQQSPQFKAPMTYDESKASFDKPLFQEETKNTSLLLSPPMSGRREFGPNRSIGPAANPAPEATVTQKPAAEQRSQEERGATGNDGKAGTGKSPLWPTMALFASLAANLFFGWIAWDIHSRYQDFVDEMSDGETRRKRQSRRLRDEPVHSRRSAESEREQFLDRGLEV